MLLVSETLIGHMFLFHKSNLGGVLTPSILGCFYKKVAVTCSQMTNVISFCSYCGNDTWGIYSNRVVVGLDNKIPC